MGEVAFTEAYNATLDTGLSVFPRCTPPYCGALHRWTVALRRTASAPLQVKLLWLLLICVSQLGIEIGTTGGPALPGVLGPGRG